MNMRCMETRVCDPYLFVAVCLAFLSLSFGNENSYYGDCTEVSTPHLDGTDDASVTCLNLGNDVTFEELLLIITRPNVCWVDHKIKWFVSCSILSRSNPARSHTPHSNAQPSLVDVLFIVEQSTRMVRDETKQALLRNILETLVNAVNDQNNYVDATFGLVVFSVEIPNASKTYRFVPLTTMHDVEEFVSRSITENDEEPSGVLSDISVFRHTSIKRSLKVMNQVLVNVSNKRKLSQKYGDSTWPQPRINSDLHIMSLLDLYLPNKEHSSKSKNKINKSVRKLKEKMENLISKIVSRALAVPNPLSLQFAFDKTNSAAVDSLGDSSTTAVYTDCTHFNKALTLKSLLGVGSQQGSTLQAHLLSVGIQSKTMTWNDLKREECVSGLIPALSTPFGLYPTFRNNCDINVSRHGSEHYYCSPIHGWVKKEDSKQGRHKTGELFEGRSPISTEFSASHADLALQKNKVDRNQSDLPLEELTIYKKNKAGSRIPGLPRITGEPTILQWSPNRPIAEEIVGGKEAVVLRNTVVQSWPAMQKWNLSYLSENIELDVLQSVKCTNTFLTFDPDRRTPLKLNISVPFVERNMTRESFFNCVENSANLNHFKCPDGFLGHYYFGSIPDNLKGDLMPDRYLYHTEKDYKSNRQFIWISSSGMITHVHFDQDFNFFVQLVGKKRFTLWSPFQHELMYTYPRVHPLWHKSQVNFQDVDIEKFPAFRKAKAVQIELGPGDMLYVPPYTWHYVETLSPSVSLSTWSNDYNMYNHMNSIYRHDHKFDLIQDQRGQMFVLRLYLDMMIHDLYGVNETSSFFAKLLQTRFSNIAHLFPPSEDDPSICNAAVPNKIPTCVHVHGYAKLDMHVIGSHFEALEPEVRDILFQDYVEEITAQVVGIKKMLAFFRYCFLGQDYYVNDVGDEEHTLWDHKDS